MKISIITRKDHEDLIMAGMPPTQQPVETTKRMILGVPITKKVFIVSEDIFNKFNQL